MSSQSLENEWSYDLLKSLISDLVKVFNEDNINELVFNEDFHFDSLKAVTFSNSLSLKLGISLPSTLVFDYPSIDSVVEFLLNIRKSKSSFEVNKVKEINIMMKKPDFSKEKIGIIGLACRFPGNVNSIEDVWRILNNKVHSPNVVPLSRWDPDSSIARMNLGPEDRKALNTIRYAKLISDDHWEVFNNRGYHITDGEASVMDPTQRLAVQIAYETFIDAGLTIDSLVGSNTGVFVVKAEASPGRSSQIPDYEQTGKASVFDITGASMSVIAGRISYVFGLRGPCFSSDAACASSLVALHTAKRSLQNGDCDMALVLGVNFLGVVSKSICTSTAGMNSPDGQCHTFDDSANGYCRAEGIGAVLLRRMSDCESDGSLVYAVIIGSMIGNDGKRASLTTPNSLSQARLIQQALLDAQINSSDVRLVEAHGTGTPLGDPIEVAGITAAYGKTNGQQRSVDNPLYITGIKANFGHMEAVAGMAGLFSLILSLHYKQAPPNAQLRQLNKNIIPIIENEPIQMPTETQNILSDTKIKSKPLIGAVNSFGFNGSISHAILMEPPYALRKQMKSPLSKNQIWQFSGQGTLKVNACYSLMETEPIFRSSLILCDSIVLPYLNHTISNILYPESHSLVLFTSSSSSSSINNNKLKVEEAQQMIEETKYAQPILVALEYCIAQVWLSRGHLPCKLIGHSLGEYTAAVIAGVWSIQDCLKVVCERGRLMHESKQCEGTMMAMRCSEKAVYNAISQANVENSVALAAVNAPNSVVVSGSSESIAAVQHIMSDVQCHKLNVNRAFHSPLISYILDDLEKVLQSVTLHAPQIPLISSASGCMIDSNDVITYEINNPMYWLNHAMSSVQYMRAVETCIKLSEGTSIVMIEIGPDNTLTNLTKKIIAAQNTSTSSSTSSSSFTPHSCRSQGLIRVLHSIDDMIAVHDLDSYCATLPMTLKGKRFPLSGSTARHRMLHKIRRDEDFNSLRVHIWIHSGLINDWLKDHVLLNNIVVPGACIIENFYSAGLRWIASSVYTPSTTENICIKDVMFLRPTIVSDAKTDVTKLRIEINSSGVAEIFTCDKRLNANAEKLVYSTAQIMKINNSNVKTIDWKQLKNDYIHAQTRCVHTISESLIKQYYSDKQNNSNLVFGPTFQLLKSGSCSSDGLESVATITVSSGDSLRTGYLIPPPMIDAMFQSQNLASLLPGINQLTGSYIPFSIDNVWFNVSTLYTEKINKTGDIWFCHCKILTQSETSGIVTDCTLLNSSGEAVLYIQGLRRRKVTQNNFKKQISRQISKSQNVVQSEHIKLVNSQWVLQPFNEIINSLSNKVQLKSCLLLGGYCKDILEKDNNFEVALVTASQHLKASNGDMANGTFLAEQTIVKHISDFNISTLENLLKSETTDKYDICIIYAESILNEIYTEDEISVSIQSTSTLLSNWLEVFEQLLTKSVFSKLFIVIESYEPYMADTNPNLLSLISLLRILKLEYPQAHITTIETVFEQGISQQNKMKLINEAVAKEIRIMNQKSPDAEISYREQNTKRFVRRYRPLQPTYEKGPWELFLSTRGSLTNLVLQKQNINKAELLRPTEVQLEAVAVSLNFKDVLNILGLYPGEIGSPGLEISGIIRSVGNEVSRFKIGDEVMGLVEGGFRQIFNCEEILLVHKPAHISFAIAATIPIVFGTVINSLKDIAKLKKDEILLVHAAAGGVGLAAIQYAKQVGARVFASASMGKHALLKNLGVEFVSTSRDPEIFLQETKAFLGESGSVDVVLNCLSGKYIEYSLDLLSKNGRFIEIGKRGVWTEEQMKLHRPDVFYNLFALDTKRVQDPVWFNSFLQSIVTDFKQGIQTTVFDFCSEYLDALQLLMKGRSVGKVVLYHGFRLFEQHNRISSLLSTTIPSTIATISSSVTLMDKSITSSPTSQSLSQVYGLYIITGGLGGLGLLTAQVLLQLGVKRIALISRTGKITRTGQGLDEKLNELQNNHHGANVQLHACDVSNEEAVIKFFNKLKNEGEIIEGIIHSAGVIHDGMLRKGNARKGSDEVWNSKALSAFYLHQHTKNDINLRVFMCYSSIAAAIGNIGQSSYAAANGFLDGLMQYRRRKGLTGISVQWPAIAEIGMAADLLKNSSDEGSNLKPSQVMVILDKLLAPLIMTSHLNTSVGFEGTVLVIPNAERYKKRLQEVSIASQFSNIIFDVASNDKNSSNNNSKYPQQISPARTALSPATTKLASFHNTPQTTMDSAVLLRLIKVEVMEVVTVDEIDNEMALIDQGLDSLGATELVAKLSKRLGIPLSKSMPYDYPTINEIHAHCMDLLHSMPNNAPSSPPTQYSIRNSMNSISANYNNADTQRHINYDQQYMQTNANMGGNMNMNSQTGLSKSDVVQAIRDETLSVVTVDESELQNDIALTDQGLDSLGATELVAKLSKRLGIPLSKSMPYDYPTINEIHAHCMDLLQADGKMLRSTVRRFNKSASIQRSGNRYLATSSSFTFQRPPAAIHVMTENQMNGNNNQNNQPPGLVSTQEETKEADDDDDLLRDNKILYLVWFLDFLSSCLRYALFFLGYVIIWFLLIVPFYYTMQVVVYVYNTHGFVPSVFSVAPMYMVCVFANLLITVIMKWIVIGRYTEGEWSVHSIYFIRWWFVDRLVNHSSRFLTQLYPFYTISSVWYYFMGCNVDLMHSVIFSAEVKEFDLITIESNSTIEYGVYVTASVLENGYLCLRKVHIGTNNHIYGRSNVLAGSIIPSGCVLLPGVCVDGHSNIITSGGMYQFNPPQSVDTDKLTEAELEHIKMYSQTTAMRLSPLIDFLWSIICYFVTLEIMTLISWARFMIILKIFSSAFEKNLSSNSLFETSSIIISLFGLRYLVAYLSVVGLMSLDITVSISSDASQLALVTFVFTLSICLNILITCLTTAGLSVPLRILLSLTKPSDNSSNTTNYSLYLFIECFRSNLLATTSATYIDVWSGTSAIVFYILIHGGSAKLSSNINLSEILVDPMKLHFGRYTTVVNPFICSKIYTLSYIPMLDEAVMSTTNVNTNNLELGHNQNNNKMNSKIINGCVNILDNCSLVDNSLSINTSYHSGCQSSLTSVLGGDYIRGKLSRLGWATNHVSVDMHPTNIKPFSIYLETFFQLISFLLHILVVWAIVMSALTGVLAQQAMSDTVPWVIVVSVLVQTGSLLVLLILFNQIIVRIVNNWGDYYISSPLSYFHTCNTIFTNITLRLYGEFLIGTPFYNWLLRGLGATVSESAVIMTRNISHHYKIEIGANVMIGQDVRIAPNQVSLSSDTLQPPVVHREPVSIQSHASVGSFSYVYGHVTIGDACVIGSGTMISPYTSYYSKYFIKGCPAQRYVYISNKKSNNPDSNSNNNNNIFRMVRPSHFYYPDVRADMQLQVKDISTLLDMTNDNDNDTDNSTTQRQVAFITGATGHLGSYVVKLLLENPNYRHMDVICLVRAKDVTSGKNRLIKVLNDILYTNDNESDNDNESRIKVVIGDQSLPRLGLTDSDYEYICQTATMIYHNAASTSHGAAYKRIKTLNVDSVRVCIDIATTYRRKAIYYASSVLGVFPNMINKEGLCPDDTYSNHHSCTSIISQGTTRSYTYGYNTSKLVAEKLLQLAYERMNVDIKIFRLGLIMGNSYDGTSPEHYLSSFLNAYITLRMVPIMKMDIISPVDTLATGMLTKTIGNDKNIKQKVLHMQVPQMTLNYKLVFKVLNQLGYGVRLVSFVEFRETVFREMSPLDAVWNEFNLYTRDNCTGELIYPLETCLEEFTHLTNASIQNNVEKFLIASLEYFISKGIVPQPSSHLITHSSMSIDKLK